MRKLIVLVFTIFFSGIAFSQQFPLQSQYQFNYSVINPSVIVENDFTSVRASFRQQWVGFSENPIATQYLSMYKGFGKNGLGVNFFNDETGGAFNKTGLSLSYAHKVILSEYESELFFGISGGASKVNISNLSDPAIINSEDIYPEVTFGIYLKKKDFRFGVSIPGLLNENMQLTNSNDNTINSVIYTMISYKYQLSDDITLLPSVLVKSAENKSQVDANLNLKLLMSQTGKRSVTSRPKVCDIPPSLTFDLKSSVSRQSVWSEVGIKNQIQVSNHHRSNSVASRPQSSRQ